MNALQVPATQLAPLERGGRDGIGRLARRTQRGQGRRRLLVAGLIALSVLLGVGSAVLAATMVRSDATVGVQDRFGDAAAIVTSFEGRFAFDPSAAPTVADLTPAQRAWLAEHTLQGELPPTRDQSDLLPLEVQQAIGIEPVTIPTDELLADLDAAPDEVLRADTLRTFDPVTNDERWVTTLDVTHPLAGTTYDAGGRTTALEGQQGLLSPSLLDAFGAEVGDVVDVPGVGPVDVVGTATRSMSRSQQLAIVAPGRSLTGDGESAGVDTVVRFADADDALDVTTRADTLAEAALAALPEPTQAQLDRVGLSAEEALQSRPYVAGLSVDLRRDAVATAADDRSLATIVGGTVTGLATVVAAVVGACAFAVGVRRRIREIGMLGAIGATPAQLSRLLRREGLVIGLGGAAVGAVAGIVLSFAAQPLVELVVDRDLQVVVPVVGALLPLVVGGLGAFLAAVWPARTAARVPTTTALAGRVPLGRVPGWLPVVGVAAAATGVALLVELTVSGTTNSGLDALQLLVAVLLATLGTATLGIPVVAGGGLLADRLPLLGRLALRDAARQRTRSAAAIAALVPVLAIPVAAGTVIFSEHVRFDEMVGGAVFAEDGTQLETLPFVDQGGSTLAIVNGPYVDGRGTPPSPAAITAVADQMPDVVARTPLVFLGAPDLPDMALAVLPRTDDGRIDPDAADVSTLDRLGWAWGRSLALATPELLDVLELPADAVPADGVLVLDDVGGTVLPEGVTALQVVQGEPSDGDVAWRQLGEVTVARATGTVGGNITPGALVGPDTAARLGLVETSRSELLQLQAVPSRAEVTAVYTALDEQVGPTTHVAVSPAPLFWTTPLGIALAIALGVVAAALGVSVVAGMTSALAATESDGDVRKAVALGAPPSLRRRLHGLQAWWHTVIAAMLGAGLGLAVAWAVVRSTPMAVAVDQGSAAATMERAEVAVHWLGLAGWVVVVPVLVGLIVAAVMRSSPVGAPRRRTA